MQFGNVDQGIAKSVALHDQFWPHAEALAKEERHSIASGLFIQALNEMIDLHSNRMLIGVQNRIPTVIWAALYLVAILSIAEIGHQTGLAGSRRSVAVMAIMLTFSIVMTLIEDLDRPTKGLRQAIDDQPFGHRRQELAMTASTRVAIPTPVRVKSGALT